MIRTLLMLALMLSPCLSGCTILGVAAQALPPKTITAAYKGLAGQSVAIIVWADDTGVQIDWPNVQLDVAQAVQSKLKVAQSSAKPKELLKTTFPVSPESVVRLQQDNPALAADSVEEVAARLGVSRVIYIEIQNLQTRSDESDDLFRGSVSGAVKVVEVSGGKGHIAFTDDNIRAVFPKNSPAEGMPNHNDYEMYRGVLDAFTTNVATLFFPHEEQK